SAPPPPLLRQARSLQHSLERTFTGHLSMPTQIQLPDLARPPTQVRQLQTHYFAHFLLWQLLGMALRSPRFLFHPGQTFAPKTLPPLVSRLGADSVLLTQRSKIERPHRSQGKLLSLFHRSTFLPWHAEVLPHHPT